MKLSQIYRTALIATTMLILSSGSRHDRIRSDELPARGQKYCPGAWSLGGRLELVQSDSAA